MQSQYAEAVHTMLAGHDGGGEDSTPPQTDPDEQQTMYVYRTNDGGIFISPTLVNEQETQPSIVESQPETDTRPATRRSVPLFVYFLLLLFLFTALDNVDTFLTMLAPTVTVTVTPVTKTLSTTVTVSVGGSGADIHGRALQPLTLSQSQTVNATGHGHQDALQAQGRLIFYNASFASQTIPGGSMFTGADGIQVQTDAGVTIPANNPPQDGIASIAAHAITAGSQGNIPAFDINGMASSSLYVKNLDPFTGGRNARDFTYITKSDIQDSVATLTPVLLQSERAALTTQLTTGESLVTPSCTPATKANHAPGDEAASVTVLVSETCTTVAYNAQELAAAAARILTGTRAASPLHFQRSGDIHIRVLSQTVNGQSATLKIQLTGTWVYQLNAQQLTALIAGKPRLDALHLPHTLPGVAQVRISGIHDNEQLPTDMSHIHLLIIYAVF